MLWELIGRLAGTCLTFRISGEPGVGKEAIAHLIHRHYPHNHCEFVKIQCRDLMGPCNPIGPRGTSPLADPKLKTALANPDNHVFYFEEIQCLSGEIQRQIVHMVNKNQATAPPWVFASSTKPLEHYQGEQLNPDLLSALDTVHIAVPPLRDHPDKIPLILSWYLNEYSKTKPSTLSALPAMPDIHLMDRLLSYSWPGNLRQLQHTAWKAFETSDWDAAIAGLDTTPNEKNQHKVDEIAAIYLMSLAQLSIQREKIIEGLMTVSNVGEIGLLDLAIYNEAVSQITNHVASDETEASQDK